MSVFDDARVIAVAVVVIAMVVLTIAGVVPRWVVDRSSAQSGKELTLAERLSAINDRRKTIFEFAGAVLLIITVIFTYLQLQETRNQLQEARKQLEINEQAQVTDRLVRTVAQIGSDRQAEQIGGMYGLRSLAVDAAANGDLSYLEVLDRTLGAFIRQHAPCTPCSQNDNPSQRPSHPVQVALYVLGDREGVVGATRLDKSRERRMVDLREVDLRGADLAALHLARVDFSGSNLSFADFTDANLGHSDFRRTILDRTQGRHKVRGEGVIWS